MPGSATVGAGEHTEEIQAAMDSSPIVPEFNSWLEALVKGNGSDLHVKVGSPPMLRLPYGLDRLDRDPLSPLETQAIADGIIPEDRKSIFKERGEVDFAYSVANVGRFRELLTDMTQQTQFLLVTHNRATIEAADTIYGVSMGEDGASRVLSLRLEELVED